MKKFWNMKANAADSSVGELYLYGDISSTSWWEDEVTPQTFKQDLDDLGPIKNLNVYVNSNGGDVFAGQAIHTMIKRHDAYVTVYVDGLAASIASVICMAGDKIVMPRNAMMLVHRPWSGCVGNSEDMRKMADALDQIGLSLVAAYQDKTGLSAEEIQSIMAAETWMTADECMEKGFCDEVLAEKKVAAAIRGNILAMAGQEFDLSKYRNRPQIEVVDELPTNLPIVEGEVEEPDFSKMSFLEIFEHFYRGQSEESLMAARNLIDAVVKNKGRTISAENEASIRAVYDGLGNHRDSLKAILDKVADDAEGKDPEPDNDPDDRVDLIAAELKPDERIDTLLAEVRALTAKVDAMASISSAPQVMQNVVDPSPAQGEDDIAPRDEVIELDDAVDEANIEVDEVKETLKAALDELKVDLRAKNDEWRLKNLGKVD